jgi:hypothetical protein
MYELLPHPDSAPRAVTAIQVEVTRPGPRLLVLRYLVSGDTAAILLPRSRPLLRMRGSTDEEQRRRCKDSDRHGGDDRFTRA